MTDQDKIKLLIGTLKEILGVAKSMHCANAETALAVISIRRKCNNAIAKTRGSSMRVEWCITYGWGHHIGGVVGQRHRAMSIRTAERALARHVRSRFPQISRSSIHWSFASFDGGTVIDFGSHTHFGFVREM